MSLTRVAILALVLLRSAPVLAGQQSEKSFIEGLVVRAGTDEPIVGAQINLTKALQPTPFRQPAASAVSNAEGRFAFTNLAPGSYRLIASRDGYVQQEYGARQPGATSTGTVLSPSPALPVKNVVIHLTPTGSVNGHIRGSMDEPLGGIEVTVLRPGYDATGSKTFQSVATAYTNDRGEYRLYWIAPGRYYLRAGSPVRNLMLQNATATENGRAYAATFYPEASDLPEAAMIEVLPGVDLNAIDVNLRRVPTYRVRGRVLDARTGQTPDRDRVSIAIVSRQDIGQPGLIPSTSAYNADGTFELRSVAPGQYWVRAQLLSDAPVPAGAASPIPPITIVPIEVAGADIENLVLTFVPDVSVSGKVTVEGKSFTVVPAGLRISLIPSAVGNLLLAPAPAAIQPGPDGTFGNTNVVPGDYRLSLSPLPTGFYIKDIRFGSIDALSQKFAIRDSADALNIVLGSDPAEVRGTVMDDRQQPVGGARVVLVPDQTRRTYLYQSVIADAGGHFVIRGITPGRYKLFAWDDLEPNQYFDSEFIAKVESKGKPVQLLEAATQTVDLSAILRRAQ